MMLYKMIILNRGIYMTKDFESEAYLDLNDRFDYGGDSDDVIIHREGMADLTFSVPALTTISRSVLNPTGLVVTLDAGQSGKYCINLYKRVY
jgi:hypothetical protein